MSARVPLDVGLEDKLLYGLTPTRLVYLVIALLSAFAIWSGHWSIAPIRGAAAAPLCAAGAAWLRRSRGAHDITTSLVIAAGQAARLRTALTDMGIHVRTAHSEKSSVFGRELAAEFLHVRGFSRTWYVDRLPGTELDPGW